MGKYEHKPLYIFFIVAVPVLFCLTAAMNALAGAGAGMSGGIFLSSTGDVSDRQYTEITPSGWTFSIWGFIYTWQVIWIIYSLTTICRTGIDGYLYLSPNVLPLSFYIIYCINMICNTSWLFAWDREELIASVIVLALIAGTLYACLVISYIAAYKSIPIFSKNGKMYEIWLIRFFHQNGITFYATWTTIATLLNMTMCVTYVGNYDQENASTIALSFLAIVIVTYFILEHFVFDKYLRYTFSHYLVLLVALGGSFDNNYVDGKRNSIFTVVLMGLAGVLFLNKIILMLVWHFKCPIKPNAISDSETALPSDEKPMPSEEKVAPTDDTVVTSDDTQIPAKE